MCQQYSFLSWQLPGFCIASKCCAHIWESYLWSSFLQSLTDGVWSFIIKHLITRRIKYLICKMGNISLFTTQVFFFKEFLCAIFKSLLNSLQYCFHFMFWFCGHKSCGILVPRPGTEPTPPTLEGEVLNHWTTREVPLPKKIN